MIIETIMKGKIILLLCAILSPCTKGIYENQRLPWQPGSCSRSCKQKHTEELNNSKVPGQSSYKYPCSCSHSCSIYGDCCFDSYWKNKGFSTTGRMSCLPLSKIGVFSAISNCPSNWHRSNDYCTKEFGNLPPVTSRRTSLTYTNMHCAVCNADSSSLITWNVEIRCCPAYYFTTRKTKKTKFLLKENHIWAVWANEDKTRTFCQCDFAAKDGNYSFTSKLEMKSCQRNEISSCSFSWSDKSVSELCKSYLDPVYLKDKVYRNLHCAICNYEYVNRDATCTPTVLTDMMRYGVSVAEAEKLCKTHKISSCVHYLVNSRGPSSSISQMLSLNSHGCVPPPKRKCCAGKRYDSNRKVCRSLFVEP